MTDSNIASENSAPAGKSGYIVVIMIGIMVLLMLGSLVIWSQLQDDVTIAYRKHDPLPVMGTVPDFKLTERNGTVVYRSDLEGRVWIADFIFTRCAGTCPAMTKSMGAVQRSLDGMHELWPPAKVVSFTVDPEWDTTDVLNEYAVSHEADSKSWLFLTGGYDQMQELAIKGFKLPMQENGDSAGEAVIHSQKFVLVDPESRIRGYYDGTDPEATRRMLADVLHLAREIAR